MRLRVDVGADARLIGLIGRPIDEALVVVGNQYRPFGARQLPYPLLDRAVSIDVALAAGLAIHVGASIHRTAEHMMNRRIGRCHPAEVGHPVGLQGERQALGAEPQPDLAHRPHLREAFEDGAEGTGDGLVGMEPDLAFVLAPDEADRQATAQGAARGLVANAPVEPRAQDVQLRLTHGAFEPEDEAVVEQRGVVDSVGIADQGIRHGAQVEEPVPVGVIARQARDLKAEHDAHPGEGDLRGQPREARALGGPGAREAQILVDDRDLFAMPAEVDRAMDEGVLPLRRLAVVFDLRGARLPDIDQRGAVRVSWFDLRCITHRSVFRGAGPRWLSRTIAPRLRLRRRVVRRPARPTRWPRGPGDPESSGSFARWPSSASGGASSSPGMGRRRRRASTTARAWSKSASMPRRTRCV